MAATADMEALAKRLLIRFKNVPNFTIDDAKELVTESMRVHGFEPDDDVPHERQRIILLYAQAEAAFQIAYSVAHYFKYTDGEEHVDKSVTAHNYRQLAKDTRQEYERERHFVSGASFYTISRADRP